MVTNLAVRDLSLWYGASQVLHGVNLDVEPGKVTAIIGPSGCGKSSLLRCLNRLNDLNRRCRVQGKVSLAGGDVMAMDPILLRRSVGMVFQKPNPFPMSIRENVLYGVKAARLSVDVDRTVQESLQKAAVWDETEHRLGESALRLSLGQQQRVCLARALAVEPQVMLLDEPTSSLDPASTVRIETSVRAMADHYTTVMVTHNLDQARRLADYTAFMFGGHLVEFGETRDLFERPRDELTRQYVTGVL